MEQQDINNTILFERYLDAEMTDKERQNFETKLESDEVLRIEFLLYKKIIQTLEKSQKELLVIHQATTQQADLETKKQVLFKAYHEQILSEGEKIKFEERLSNEKLFSYEWNTYFQEEKDKKVVALTKRKRIYRNVMAGAAVMLVLIMGYWWNGQISDYNQLVANYYEVPDNYLTETIDTIMIKGEPDENVNLLLQQGLAAYTSAKYDSTIYYLNQYVVLEGTTDTASLAQLYIGIAYYEQGNYNKAIDVLKSGSENIQDLIYHGKLRNLIQWHLGLTYLKVNKKEEALVIFKYLSTDAKYFIVQGKAIEIIPQLK
jgi:tetratricopeptide (TPR) repeat protein